MKKLLALFLAGTAAWSTLIQSIDADVVVDFEELSQFTGDNPAGGGQFYNGNNGTGSNSTGWSSGGVFFNNAYTDAGSYDYWSGWSYSNVVNTTTAGYTNQYAAFPGGGYDGVGGSSPGGKYAISYGGGAYFNLPDNLLLSSIQLSNSTYAALSIRDGDLFAKQFGGSTGNDPDFFRVTLTGFDSAGANGNTIGDISINLADFTFSDNSNDYILDEWLEVDLTSLSAARSIQISYASSDMTTSGLINTPTYLAVDNLTLRSIPEPNTVILLSLLTSFWGAVRRRTQ